MRITTMMNKDFALLVLISALIGCPLAYLLMKKWLADFAYHIDIGFATLLGAALIVFVTSVLTVSYKAISAALADPVRSLRYE